MEYYNGSDVLNNKCPINFVLSNRTAGKSFYWKRYCINEFIKKKHKFIYIRRNKIDLDISYQDFFKDISFKFPGYGMICKGDKFYIGKVEKGEIIDPLLCGYGFSLSTIQRLKSIPLFDVNTIFFDEFLPDDMRFLHPNEPTYEPNMILSLYMTVARGYKQVFRDDVMFIACANVVSRFNPYFSTFGVDLSRVNKYKSKSVYACITFNNEVANILKESKIGDLLMSTDYGKYALENIPLVDVESNIYRHKKQDKAYCEIYFNNEWYICYYSIDNDYIIIGCGYDETLKRKYKINEGSDLSEVPFFTGDILKLFKEMAKRSKIKYESMHIKVKLSGFINPTIQKV